MRKWLKFGVLTLILVLALGYAAVWFYVQILLPILFNERPGIRR